MPPPWEGLIMNLAIVRGKATDDLDRHPEPTEIAFVIAGQERARIAASDRLPEPTTPQP
jgi:hypothetical protein